MSRYSTDELVERLRGNNSPGSVVALDIDDTLSESPTKYIFAGSVFKPSRWWRNPEWGLDALYVLPTALMNGWSMNKIELFCFSYADQLVMPIMEKRVNLKEVAKEESPPFFPGVIDFVGHYSDAERIAVSRTFEEIVADNVKDLNLDGGYCRADDKAGVLLEHLERTGARKVLLFGDLDNDFEAGEELREAGYEVDMVQVCKHFDRKLFDPRATIYIPRNWMGLYELVKNRPVE